MTAVPPDATSRARALLGDFIEGHWEQTRGEFHNNIRGHLDSGRIAHGWDHATSSGGGIMRIGEPSARQFGDYTVVDVPLTFNAGQGLGCVALDQQGKVAGLSMQYPRRSRLDPRPSAPSCTESPGSQTSSRTVGPAVPTRRALSTNPRNRQASQEAKPGGLWRLPLAAVGEDLGVRAGSRRGPARAPQ
jgi:hypothetical protein